MSDPVRDLIAKWRANADMLAEGNKNEHEDPSVGMQRACADALEAAVPVSAPPQDGSVAVGTRWKDKAMPRFVRVVHVTDAKVSYRNEATGRLTVTRGSTFSRMFEPAEPVPVSAAVPPQQDRVILATMRAQFHDIWRESVEGRYDRLSWIRFLTTLEQHEAASASLSASAQGDANSSTSKS